MGTPLSPALSEEGGYRALAVTGESSFRIGLRVFSQREKESPKLSLLTDCFTYFVFQFMPLLCACNKERLHMLRA
jgi:hypothetical protein